MWAVSASARKYRACRWDNAIYNNSASSLAITSLAVSGADAGDFGLGPNPGAVAANSYAVVSVSFQPQSAGTKHASVVIGTFIGGFPPQVSVLSVALTGTALAPPPPPPIGPTVNPTAIDFGSAVVGGPGVSKPFQIHNNSSSSLAITSSRHW